MRKYWIKRDLSDNGNVFILGKHLNIYGLLRVQIKLVDTDHGRNVKMVAQLSHPFHVMDT